MNGTDYGDPAGEARAREGHDRPLAVLFRELYENTIELVRRELNLAVTETSRKLSRAGRDSRFIAIGWGVAFAGFLLILAAAVIELSVVMPVALAAFLVGVVVAATGGFIIYMGRKRLRDEQLVPVKTMDVLREDKEWLQNLM